MPRQLPTCRNPSKPVGASSGPTLANSSTRSGPASPARPRPGSSRRLAFRPAPSLEWRAPGSAAAVAAPIITAPPDGVVAEAVAGFVADKALVASQCTVTLARRTSGSLAWSGFDRLAKRHVVAQATLLTLRPGGGEDLVLHEVEHGPP